MPSYDDLADRLEQISAELDEASFDLLQQAAADGATERPDADRVEKAAGLLRGIEQ